MTVAGRRASRYRARLLRSSPARCRLSSGRNRQLGHHSSHVAAIGNHPDMARLLIERGADVNHVDKAGMTPLLYAASIDFGDCAMIDPLLKSGAHTDARTKDGLTALDLARKYNHTHLLASLSGPMAAR